MDKEAKAIEMQKDESVSFDKLFDFLCQNDIGYWDGVNSTETIQMYIKDMMKKEVKVSHILKAIEEEESEHEQWEIWLGNSMNTPKPINTKDELMEALGIN